MIGAQHKLFRGMAWAGAFGFLGVGLPEIPTAQKDLEQAFLHAFCVGVQSVLNDAYSTNDYDCSGETETDGDLKSSDESEDEKSNLPNQIQFDQVVNPQQLDFDSSTSKDKVPPSIDHARLEHLDSYSMLEPHLIQLYKSAHEHAKSKLSIQLQCQPYSVEMVSIFGIPFLTREEVERKPALRHTIRNLFKDLEMQAMEKGRPLSLPETIVATYDGWDQMATKQYKRNRGEKMQTTVIAQVALQCQEIFCVRDVESGEVIQGDSEGNINDVTHLCRFEVVVDVEPLSGRVEIGTWRITDLDDLLDGNIWFA